MKRYALVVFLLLAVSLLTSQATKKAAAPAGHKMVMASELKWGPSPVPGFESAVVSGDPSKPGPYIMRLRAAGKHASVAPHWHPTDENITVISGSFKIGEGDTVDEKSMQELKVGDFAMMPAKVHHYGSMDSGSVVQLHGNGPFQLMWVNPPAGESKSSAKAEHKDHKTK